MSQLWFLARLALTLTWGMCPSYKTFKALESRSLRASQSMMLYWIITAFINGAKELVDSFLGTYSSFFVWKMTVLALKAAPLLIGPDRLYNHLVKPLYQASEQKVDAVVDEAHKLKAQASSALPALKEGNMSAAEEKVAAVLETAKEDASDLVSSLKAQALQLGDSLQAKSAELGWRFDKEGVVGVLDALMEQVEAGREVLAVYADQFWTAYGPTIVEQSTKMKDAALRNAPIVREKGQQFYTARIAPRVQPMVQSAQECLVPYLLAKRDRAAEVWLNYGGPVRTVYVDRVRPFLRDTLQPFVTMKVIPFLIDSVLPAVYETVVALQHRLADLLREPSAETRESRVHHKRRRAEGINMRRERRKGNSSSAQQQAALPSEAESSHVDKKQRVDDAASAEHFDDNEDAATGAFESAATLTNRKQRRSIDASLGKDESALRKQEQATSGATKDEATMAKASGKEQQTTGNIKIAEAPIAPTEKVVQSVSTEKTAPNAAVLGKKDESPLEPGADKDEPLHEQTHGQRKHGRKSSFEASGKDGAWGNEPRNGESHLKEGLAQ